MSVRRAAALLLLAGLASCAPAAKGDGVGVVRRSVAAERFTGVTTGSGIDVQIARSDAWAVELAADRQVIDRIVVEKRGEVLWIGLPDGVFARGRFLASQARVLISIPGLERLEAGGGSRVQIGMNQPETDLEVILSGGSSLAGTLVCADLSISGSGGSVFQLSGSAAHAALSGSGGSHLRLSSLQAISVDVELSGRSTAALSVSERLSVTASGGSGVAFRGDARVERQELSGGAWLRRE